MKKCIYKKIAGTVFAALLVTFVSVSCNSNVDNNETPANEEPKKEEPKELAPDMDGDTIHAMILPTGTGATINPWEKAANALEKNLPEFVTSFNNADNKTLNGKTNRTAELKAAVEKAVKNNSFADKEVKNVIIVFGDGMGESHLLGSRKYYNDLIMDLLPYHAPVNHDAYLKPEDDPERDLTKLDTTDSSAGGTAIVTGFKTRYGYIGLDVDATPVKNLAELAREKGMIVGNVTNDHMGDATPADVSIHDLNRNHQNVIYGKLFASSPDLAMGSDYGYKYYIQEGVDESAKKSLTTIGGERDNDDNEVSKYGQIASVKTWFEESLPGLQPWALQMLKVFDNTVFTEKYSTATTYDFNNWAADRKMHSYSSFTKLMNGVQADYNIRAVSSYSYGAKYAYEEGEAAPKYGYKLGYVKKSTKPSYPEMVASTLSILDHKAKTNNTGFYCLIENTCSDGWGHAEKPYDCLNEIQCFDEGVAIALKYVLENPDTLLVITADHETGGLEYRKNWETNYKKIKSSTNNHSSKPVPVMAFGAKADLFPKREDTSGWTPTDWADYVAGEKKGVDYSYQNRQTGILIGKAMGFDKFGDLNANGVLDPDTESDSIVTNSLY